MDQDKKIIRQRLKIQSIIINLVLDKFKEETDKVAKDTLCKKCQFKRRGCRPCKAFTNFSRALAEEKVEEGSQWN